MVRAHAGQPDNQSLTIYFVGDFLLVARFLLGFWMKMGCRDRKNEVGIFLDPQEHRLTNNYVVK